MINKVEMLITVKIQILCLLFFNIHVLSAQEGGIDDLHSMDLYLCIGQSNMAGRALLQPELMDTLQNVYLLNDKGEFEPAVNPLNRYSTIRKDLSMQRLGPVYSFAKELSKETGRPIGLIVNARGETVIQDWLKGSPKGYYKEALERVRVALRSGGVLRAILWHQGEGNSGFPESYRKRLTDLVESFRQDLNAPQLPFVFGEISQWEKWAPKGTKEFNEMLNEMATIIPYSACVSSKGLDMYKDESNPHFGTKGQLLLGKRYAEEIMKLVPVYKR